MSQRDPMTALGCADALIAERAARRAISMTGVRIIRWLACVALALVAATTWRAYQQPEFALWLNNALWLCT
jgi:hypothetical protein